MAYLGNIIKHLESLLEIKIHGRFHSRAEIDCVLFLQTHNAAPSLPDCKKLYIGYFTDLAQIPSFPNLLLLNCTKKEAVETALFVVENLNIFEVFNIIQDMIAKQYCLKANREKLFKTLYSENGLQGLVYVAHEHLKNTITICDTSFSILCAAPSTNDPQSLEEKNGRLYLKDDLFQDMVDKKVIEHIYSSNLPFVVKFDDFPYKWAFQSIRMHHITMGYICVRASERELTEDDLDFIILLSQMISIELQKNPSYSYPTGLRYEFFLTELLSGTLTRTSTIHNRLLQLEKKPQNFYFVIIIDFPEEKHKQRFVKNYYEQILLIFPNSMVAFYRENLTLLLPSNTTLPFSEKIENRFATFLQLNQMHAYISYPFFDISKTHMYYKQAETLSSLKVQNLNTKKHPFVFYNTYFLEHIVTQCQDYDLLTTSIHPDIQSILEYDKQNGSDYGNTLRIYLEENRNAVAASTKLNVHKSTFFYRLSKIADLFDIDVNDGIRLFAYEYSFRVLNFLEEKY